MNKVRNFLLAPLVWGYNNIEAVLIGVLLLLMLGYLGFLIFVIIQAIYVANAWFAIGQVVLAVAGIYIVIATLFYLKTNIRKIWRKFGKVEE